MYPIPANMPRNQPGENSDLLKNLRKLMIFYYNDNAIWKFTYRIVNDMISKIKFLSIYIKKIICIK